MTFDSAVLGWHLPLLVVVIGSIVLLLLEAFARGSRRWLMHLSALTCVIALGAAVLVWIKIGDEGAQVLYGGMLVADGFSTFLIFVFVVAALLVSLLSGDFLRSHGALYGEFYPLVLLATSGMIILAMAADLVTVFIGIETMSLAAYVLTGSFRRAKKSQEAALKYFVAGAFASGFLLYGIALVYGAVGDTSFAAIRTTTQAHSQPIFLVGELMLIVSFAFKVSAVPFHMWAPDAYEGAPTPVTAFMATGVKAAAFAGVLRLFITSFGGDVLPYGRFGWASILGVLAVATMTLGNLAALRQDNVKRMLAYSSISHAGYLLVGVVAAGVTQGVSDAARPAMLYYLLAYTFTTIGAFGVVAWLDRGAGGGPGRALPDGGGARVTSAPSIDDWAGLASRHPGAALAMTIFLLSLGGMPPTAGFFGKFYVFRAAMEAPGDQLLWLVIAGVVNSVISIYYYLRVVMAMYFREPAREPMPVRSATMAAALFLAALFVLEMGTLPGTWLKLTDASTMLSVIQP